MMPRELSTIRDAITALREGRPDDALSALVSLVEPPPGSGLVLLAMAPDGPPRSGYSDPWGTRSGKIETIKAVREITGLGLKEAKELVESLPQKLFGATLQDAERLTRLGAVVEWR